ncbi:glycosyltransferase [Candidatus Litorirhabdus singularis]|nr:glycosyltransferase [Candidatus Litorirhabdus singularis]
MNERYVSMGGVLMALGDFPEGNATATRLKMISKTGQSTGLGIAVEILQATLKKKVPENASVCGEVEGIRFRYLSGSVVRPVSLPMAVLDTLRGLIGGVRLLAFPRSSDRLDFIIFYTPSFLKHSLPMLIAVMKGIPVFVEACEIRSKTTGGITRHAIVRMFDFTEKWMEWISPRVASGIIPISHTISDFYREKGISEEKLFLLPILIDCEVYRKTSASFVKELEGKVYFLNSGSFVEKDGVGYIVAAFIEVLKKTPDIFLVFTGNVSDSDKDKVRAVFLENSLPENVIFPGMLSRAELVWAYQNANALLSCRTNSKYANFGFPTKIGEYLASGTIVIATRVGDTEIYLEDKKTALLAEPESVASIASCMTYVIKNLMRSKAIGLSGRKIAQENFDYRVHADPLRRFIEGRLQLADQ